MQKNPDLTMRELGDEAGLSHTPCWRRIQALRERGVIKQKRYILDPEALGYHLCLFCFIRMREHSRDALNAFEEAVSRVPQVMQTYSVTGDYDYLLRLIAQSVLDYEQTIKNHLVSLPHVASVSTTLTLKEVKNTTDIPV